MIIGIGTDVVAVVRMAALWQRQGMRLGRRILAPEELDGLLFESARVRVMVRPSSSLALIESCRRYFSRIGA